jgi:hypothetical protein
MGYGGWRRWITTNDAFVGGGDMEAFPAGVLPHMGGISFAWPGLLVFYGVGASPRISGSRCLVLQNQNFGANLHFQLGSGAPGALYGIVPGFLYRISAYVYLPSPQGGWALAPADHRLTAYTNVGSLWRAPTAVNEWQYLEMDWIIAPAANTFYLRLTNRDGGLLNNNIYAYWDQLSVRAMQTVLPSGRPGGIGQSEANGAVLRRS